MRSVDRPSIPLDQHVGFAPRVRVRCQAPKSVGICTHEVILRTEDLYAAAPGAVTERDFRGRLRCSRCGARGWATIAPAGR